MRLAGKQLLMIVGNGVDEEEVEQLCSGFANEQAEILLTSAEDCAIVQTVHDGRRGRELTIDIPLADTRHMHFSGLIIPDGLVTSRSIYQNESVIEVIHHFYLHRVPIFASGNAVQLLYESAVLSEHILIREGTPMVSFLDRAVGILQGYIPAKT